MKLVTAIAVTLVSMSAAFADSSNPSAEEILRQIRTEGAKTVLRRLWDRNEEFGKVCDRIQSGEHAWLEVAQRFKAVSDAGASLSIDYSVARALPVAPIRVLSLIDHGFQLGFICTSPFIESEPGVAESYRRRAIEALQKPVPSDLEQVRKECLEKIRASLPHESR